MNVAYGLTKEQYSEIKNAIKAELNFKVSVRIHRKKSAYGAIDIRPVAENGYLYTHEQIDELLDFLNSHGLMMIGQDSYYENRHYVYHQGMHLIYRKEA